ncbi:MAG TPA: hypothetical protein VN812_10500 [Candidatus Acidoferrales bacterium]|nr:hypothetical protein [Candidatus Acidoferrales bacterium]
MNAFRERRHAPEFGEFAPVELIELLLVLAVLAVLGELGVEASSVLRQRAYDAVALSDVLSAGKALEALDDDTTFSETIEGPASIPRLPGPRVSKGTTLNVQRTRQGSGFSTYVRGSHHDGSATYYLENGALLATDAKLG